jgi:hypothetical protein
MDSLPQKLDVRAYDDKPIWEQFLKEIIETRRELCERLDRTEAILRENHADLRAVEDRVDRIERKLPQ